MANHRTPNKLSGAAGFASNAASEANVPTIMNDAFTGQRPTRKLRRPAAEPRDNHAQPVEQRKVRRFPLVSPATIRWLGSDGALHEALGTVSNISTCGAFIETAVLLRLNTNVEVEISPVTLRPEAPNPKLNLEGKVVRVETTPPRQRIAVSGFLSLVMLREQIC